MPVTLKFFKEHSFYDEVVDAILKSASKNNPKKFEEQKNNLHKRETCIRNYYRNFYLNPGIRIKLPLRLKPMPQKIREKFLSIPGENDIKFDVNWRQFLQRQRKLYNSEDDIDKQIFKHTLDYNTVGPEAKAGNDSGKHNSRVGDYDIVVSDNKESKEL